ncbi:MAG: hypothetical protein H7A25_16260 [Leptospiraceae bacterium]|nr:hypothetical protein [Leptospiraceae bacterium]
MEENLFVYCIYCNKEKFFYKKEDFQRNTDLLRVECPRCKNRVILRGEFGPRGEFIGVIAH